MTSCGSPPCLPAANLLGAEASPYLLQHKDNPVHWRPWGEAALAEARAMRRPILLSVGYAACHWCHVMAHESFENDRIAAVMNELFVNIKVDREERPDIDQIYMAALHALGEQGGWPLTMFLTPDGDPFWGGTYFPPVPRFGRPGFPDVLRTVANLFAADPDRIEQNRQALRNHLDRPLRAGTESIGRAELDEVARRLATIIDPDLGGPRGAPKFPSASFLELIWRASLRAGDPMLERLVLTTLDRICRGGIRDHVGGGFARYTIDERWLIPHFEKMLYDNAQLLELLTLAHQRTGSGLHASASAELVEWLAREMMAGDGSAFAASLDADSEGHEGRFYVWTPAAVDAALEKEEAAYFKRRYDISEEGNWEGVSIPNRLVSTSEQDGDPADECRQEELWQPIRRALLKARAGRVPPGRDDKVLADWNGMMIAALARAASHHARADWLGLAEGAYRFVTESMSFSGRLGHSWRAGLLTLPGLASDYAMMIRAALCLAELTGQPRFIDDAQAFAETVERHYRDDASGGYFLASDDARDLILRPLPTLDEAIPNHNAVMVDNLLRLAAVTGTDHWRRRADEILVGLSAEMAANMYGHAGLFNALDLRVAGAEIVILGRSKEAGLLHASALALPSLTRLILRVEDLASLPASHPARAKADVSGDKTQAAAFVCVGNRCSLPVRTVDALLSTYAAMRAA